MRRGGVILSNGLLLGSRFKQMCHPESGIMSRVGVCTLTGWSITPRDCNGKLNYEIWIIVAFFFIIVICYSGMSKPLPVS